MRNKNKRIRENKHKRFLERLKFWNDYLNSTYPNWQNGKKSDVDYIKKRINQLAKQDTTGGVYINKTKIVYKKDFGDKWPFKVDSVIIVQTAKKNAIVKMVTVLIGFEQFALSGLAANYFNIKLVGDTDKQIKGISTGPFLKIGVEL